MAYLGGDYQVNEYLGLSLYSSRLKDAWNQHYAGLQLEYPLGEDLA